MHYIIGTQITVTQSRPNPVRPGMSSQQIRATSRGMSSFTKERELFDSGKVYTITRIYMKEDKVCYRFNSVDGTGVEVMFNTVGDAERFISEVKGETVPDYEQINRDKSD